MATRPPTFDRLMNALLRALRALGGSGSVEEIYDKVVEVEKLPEDVLSQLHDPEKSAYREAPGGRVYRTRAAAKHRHPIDH